MDSIKTVLSTLLTLAGSLGVFLYGMKLLSEGLQKVAGDKMRDLLAAMTSTTIKRIMTGLLVTAVVQSSSATTVMVVSFVQAGLLSLIQAAGVIMGANVGTTITAWIIALLGFKLNIGALSLPLIGIAAPLLFSKRDGRRSLGELILGFSLIFLGLAYLKDAIPNLQDYPAILEALGRFSNLGFFSVVLYALIGAVMTVVVQSSSATMALVLVMCSNGWIGFPMACSMILGLNVGTTVTAIIAAAVGNISAKRAAFFHLIFNIFGLIWGLAVFYPFVDLVSYITVQGGMENPGASLSSIPFALSMFHTLFNIANVLFLVWFTPQIARLIVRLMPLGENEDEEFRLRHLNVGTLSTGELALDLARKETIVFARRVRRMFNIMRSMMGSQNDKELQQIYERVIKYENISDRVEVEIANYLGQINSSDISSEANSLQQALLKIIGDIESIADYCDNAAKIWMRKRKMGVEFSQDVQGKIDRMFDLVDGAFAVMEQNLTGDYNHPDLEAAYACEDRINRLRNELRAEHVKNIEDGMYSYQAGIFFSDMYSQCERMGDNIINITEDIAEMHTPIKGLDTDEEEARLD
ncbi:MAG: Na/Pi cotransporter [Bacteroidia bacterium]|nr:MAG: Na/Pi cotransporter [Bacteroidia bacterium]